jgi:hypothetical protein
VTPWRDWLALAPGRRLAVRQIAAADLTWLVTLFDLGSDHPARARWDWPPLTGVPVFRDETLPPYTLAITHADGTVTHVEFHGNHR